MKETGRERFTDRELFVEAAECRWQFLFLPPDQSNNSYFSVFCGRGDWNNNIGDLLEDNQTFA
ncbi:MAG: hypothetical protein P4L51_07425 [Puia sp.]|nr:hypothetical protein [Puia sp.]